MRRFFEVLLVLYALFLIVYLLSHFIIKADWSWLLLLHNGAPYLFLPIIIGLLLTLLLRAPRLAGVYFLLLLLGLLWLLPALLPKAQDSHSLKPIRLLSFNIYPHNASVTTATDWLLAQDADLIFLQDISRSLPELEAVYPYYEYNPSDSSLAFFSRYPIVASSEFVLDEMLQQRVILHIEGQDIVFYNLHLLMPLNERESDFILFRYDESRRNAQIANLLNSAQAETLPLVMLGDFNLSEWSPVYQELSAHYQDAFRQSSWGLGSSWPAGASEELPDIFPPLARLDYVWLGTYLDASSATLGPRIGSDHLPLLIEFRVEED